jgi:creatinine amidohydrolase
VTELAAVTWPDIAAEPVLLVPIGSTEQHGPHLPLSTDTIIATAVARALAGEVPAYVTPAISIGASGEHQDFPGVMSIGVEALRLVVVELVRSLSNWASRVVLVNGHGGNVAALIGAVNQLQAEGHNATWIACLAPGDAHAGRTETSMMLHLEPQLVKSDKFEAGNDAPIRQLLPDLVEHGVRFLSPNGVLGDPRGASADEGSELFAQVVENARTHL